MSLAKAPDNYSSSEQNQLRATLERELDRCRRTGQDIELSTERLILKSPDGTRYALTVADDGTLSTEAA